jgi:uncharacterized membrane protein YoaK (UPF0700 family)
MIVIGPLIGALIVTGIAGALAGRLIGTLVVRHASRPFGIGRVAAWGWAAMLLAGGGFAGIAALTSTDPLSTAVAAFFLWAGAVNAASGALAIRHSTRRLAEL